MVLLEGSSEITIEGLRDSLSKQACLFNVARSAASSSATRSRVKKTARATEQHRPDVLLRREACRERQD